MKKLKFLLLFAALIAGLAACDTEPVNMKGGLLPDSDHLENINGSLRSLRSLVNRASIGLVEDGASKSNKINYILSQPATQTVNVTVVVDLSYVDTYNTTNGTSMLPFPAANVSIAAGGALTIAAGERTSNAIEVTFIPDGLEQGTYLLPITAGDGENKRVMYYGIRVRGLDFGNYELETEHLVVMYLNTTKYQPLLADKWLFQCEDGNWDVQWQRTFGYIVNLRINTLNYDEETGRAMFVLGSDMRHVLNNADKYIRPMQDKGRKVCLTIEGGGRGLGFCNLTDAQITDFVGQVKNVIEQYDIDGVNLFDRYSAYGKEGMPAMNTTSYPKLIKALREALGAGKLLTVSDYEEPTEYFWDTAATGGISVGDYIDYAWSGYMSEDEDIQLLDPYETIEDPYYLADMVEDDTYVMSASHHVRKPIAGLDKEKYGHFAVPFYRTENNPFWEGRGYRNIGAWTYVEYAPNHIIVFGDIMSNEQSAYEGSWNAVPYATIAAVGYGALDGTYSYIFYLLDKQGENSSSIGYGYMLKDW